MGEAWGGDDLSKVATVRRRESEPFRDSEVNGRSIPGRRAARAKVLRPGTRPAQLEGQLFGK